MWLGPSVTTLLVAGRSLFTTVTVLLALLVLPLTGVARRPPVGPRRAPVARRSRVAARSVTVVVSVVVLFFVVSTAVSLVAVVSVVVAARSVPTVAAVSTAFAATVFVVSVVKSKVAVGAAWSVVTSFVVATAVVGSWAAVVSLDTVPVSTVISGMATVASVCSSAWTTPSLVPKETAETAPSDIPVTAMVTHCFLTLCIL